MLNYLLAISILVGGSYSRGMGEHPFAPIFQAKIHRISVLYEPSKKLESDQGYIFNVDVEHNLGSVIVGAGYKHRNGGVWTKDGFWLIGGVGNKYNKILIRHELPTSSKLNDVWALSFVTSVKRIEIRNNIYNYRQQSSRRIGVHSSISLILFGN